MTDFSVIVRLHYQTNKTYSQTQLSKLFLEQVIKQIIKIKWLDKVIVRKKTIKWSDKVIDMIKQNHQTCCKNKMIRQSYCKTT